MKDSTEEFSELLTEAMKKISSQVQKELDDDIQRIIMEDFWEMARESNRRNKEMSAKYVWQLKDINEYRGVYLECLSGWFGLIQPLIDFVLDNGGTVDQVKEKFGGLRFYYTQNPDNDYNDEKWVEFRKLVGKAEDASYHICEATGAPGKLMSNGGWLRTLSPDVAKEYGYDKEVVDRF